MDHTAHGILQARILEWVAFPFSRGSPQPRDRTQYPALQANSLAAEPQGKEQNALLILYTLHLNEMQVKNCSFALYPKGCTYQPT